MVSTLFVQFYRFWALVALGMGLAFLFDVYRAFARGHRLRRYFLALTDAFFWLSASGFTLMGLYIVTWWNFRLYVFFSLALGVTLYGLLASPLLYLTFLRLFQAEYRLLSSVRRHVLGVYRSLSTYLGYFLHKKD